MNTGNSSVTISSINVTGAGFSVGPGISGATIAAGQMAQLSVVFAPKAAGSVSGAGNGQQQRNQRDEFHCCGGNWSKQRSTSRAAELGSEFVRRERLLRLPINNFRQFLCANHRLGGERTQLYGRFGERREHLLLRGHGCGLERKRERVLGTGPGDYSLSDGSGAGNYDSGLRSAWYSNI